MVKYKKGTGIGSFLWVGKQEEIRKREKDEIKFKEYINISGVATFIGLLVLIIGLILTTIGWGIINVFTLCGSILLGVMILHIIVCIVCDDIQEGKMVTYGLVIPIIISMIIRHRAVSKEYPSEGKMDVKDKYGKLLGRMDEELERELSYNISYKVLNTKVELDNGYITYLCNILKSDKSGVKTTIGFDVVKDKKYLLATGFTITEDNADDFYNQLKVDYQTSTTFYKQEKYYNNLRNQEKTRQDNLKYINENKDSMNQKREEIKDYLYTNFRKSSHENKVKELNDHLEVLKEELKSME